MPADVSELEALAAKMKAAGARVRREQAKIVKETADKIAEDAKGLAPVGATHSLRDSIEPTASGLRGRVTTANDHALFMEYGTYKDAPQPYMGPARDQNVEPYIAASKAAAEQVLDF